MRRYERPRRPSGAGAGAGARTCDKNGNGNGERHGRSSRCWTRRTMRKTIRIDCCFFISFHTHDYVDDDNDVD